MRIVHISLLLLFAIVSIVCDVAYNLSSVRTKWYDKQPITHIHNTQTKHFTDFSDGRCTSWPFVHMKYITVLFISNCIVSCVFNFWINNTEIKKERTFICTPLFIILLFVLQIIFIFFSVIIWKLHMYDYIIR